MKTLLILLGILFTATATASTPGFDNLSQDDLDKISKEFSANFVHRPVSPAAGLGSVFGFEVGLIAGVTDAPDIAAITQRENPTQTDPFDKIAHAGLFGAVTVPYGITGELILLPERELGDVTISNMSLGVKWTLTQSFPIPFIDLAIRGHFSTSEVSYSDTVDGANTTISLDNSTYGINTVVSADFLILEPFAGVGFVTRETDLAATGSATIFDTTFTASQSASVDGSSAQFFAGLQLDLGFFHIAGQYENVFGTNIYSGKLTFAF